MEAQTFFGVAAPIYPTHKPLSTQCFTSIVVTNNRHFLLAWGSQPLFVYFPTLGQRVQAVLRLLVGAILLCAYLVEHEGIEPSCRALPNAGFNARSDLLCPRKEGDHSLPIQVSPSKEGFHYPYAGIPGQSLVRPEFSFGCGPKNRT